MKPIAFVALVITLIGLLTHSNTSQAAAFCTPIETLAETQLVQFEYVRAPVIDGDYAVWAGHDGEDYEVYLHDFNSGITKAITHNGFEDAYPSISGTNIVYSWSPTKGDGWYKDLAWYNIATEETVYITNDEANDSPPKIHGNDILWLKSSLGLFHYSLKTGLTTKLADHSIALIENGAFTLRDGYAVWSEYLNGSSYEIVLYDLENHIRKVLTDNDVVDAFPNIDGTNMVWNSNGNLVLYDRNTEQITTLTQASREPLSLPYEFESNNILWGRDSGWDAREIVRYDLNTGELTPITLVTETPWVPQLGGSGVAWNTEINNEYHVVHFDLNTGVRSQVYTVDYYYNIYPGVQDSRIVWYSNYSGETSILYAACGEAPDVTQQPQSQTVVSGNSVTLSVAVEGSKPLSYQWYQGEVGDTSSPVGTNSPSYVTPLLTQTTKYWVRAKNPLGSINSNLATITVAASTATPDITATSTVTPTATLAITGTPSLSTATPTSETPAATITATATVTATPAAGLETITNGGFEAALTPWVVKNATGDKFKCNKDGKPPVTTMGVCAFVFKGGAGENSKLEQTAALTDIAFSNGDRLDLSAWVKATNASASGKLKVRVKYSDGTATGKIDAPITQNTDYAELAGSYVLMSANVSKIKVQINHKSGAGKV
jgi:hypothetical protein